MTVAIGLVTWAGLALVASWTRDRRRPLWRVVAGNVGIPVVEDRAVDHLRGVMAWLSRTGLTNPWGSDAQIARLAESADIAGGVVAVRWRQVRHLIVLLLVIAVWAGLRQASHPGNPSRVAFALAGVALPCSGWLVRVSLQNSAHARTRLIDAQLPAVLELLAFAIAAGEGTVASLRRVVASTSGPLPALMQDVSLRLATGATLNAELGRMASRSGSPSVVRAVHAITIATERGTPLAEVLRAQAADARAEHLRQMLELAGRREAAMMLPVVFLILPMIVLVAVYPGMVAFRVW